MLIITLKRLLIKLEVATMKIISFMILMSFLITHIIVSLIAINNSLKNIKKMKLELQNNKGDSNE